MLGTPKSAAPETRSVLGCRSINKQSFISFLAGRKTQPWHHSFPWSNRFQSWHLHLFSSLPHRPNCLSTCHRTRVCVCQTSRSEKKTWLPQTKQVKQCVSPRENCPFKKANPGSSSCNMFEDSQLMASGQAIVKETQLNWK